MTKARIVVIDDEADITTFLSTALGDNGFEVHERNDCARGLALIRELVPDLICLDVLMPQRSGLSLYRELKQDEELDRIPILMISGLGVESELDQLLDGLPPPDEYLEKPVDPSVLLETVERMLASSHG